MTYDTNEDHYTAQQEQIKDKTHTHTHTHTYDDRSMENITAVISYHLRSAGPTNTHTIDPLIVIQPQVSSFELTHCSVAMSD
jgi:hypothetical protein